MGKIFYVMGKSASGKDTIYRKLRGRMGTLRPVTPYTTRPIRPGETEGVEYHFSTDQELERYREEGKVVEERTYQTVHGPWTYFTLDDGQVSPDGFYLMIGTLESYEKMRDYFGREVLVPIYIQVEDGVRYERAKMREKILGSHDFEEMHRRFQADSEDFSEENIRRCGIGKRYDNMNLESCLDEICRDIELLTENRSLDGEGRGGRIPG